MKITMISNYINHHQIPFSQALYEKEGVEYIFIQTEPMEEERIRMGWGLDPKSLPYVKLLYEEEAACRQLIDECDMLLVGWMEHEDIIKERLEADKLTIRMSERLYREGQYKAISPRGLIRKYNDHTKYRNGNVYLLCFGAYVASDFNIVRAYPNKMYRFGYFPETRVYEGESLFAKKPSLDTVHIVWAGRFMPLKHPEFVLRLAKDLKEAGHTFHIHFVGGGELEEELLRQREEWNLTEEITMYGFMSPEKVREIMRVAQEPVSLETPIGEEEDSHLGDFIEDDNAPAPADAASHTLLREQLSDVLKTLTPREEKVLMLRFGLEDGRSRTLEEVGKEFQVTRERIRQIEAKALRKLRHPSRSKKLKDFCN